ncbi:succinyldiaminopimelate transaminase [Saccharothrix longispora]|uniref:Aminotransferase n=1 Tax=Saccharothrix longispora TaxID=33920 RepID=A0ABU1Q5M1_9PSEU|nr:succinyldiaminopimelate transaminase [Saccharothrix longispora]MDR6598188.1 succinyldiaminopimelate transaminase [Saccharothrix longispora]
MTTGRRLPDFPWDSLADHAAKARTHPGGVVDLSIGTPVDPVPDLVREALASVSDEPGYPTTHGTPALREAVVGSMARRYGVDGLDPTAVLPTIGSKELVAWLPTLLGLGPGDVVAIPALAYPTYEVGARLAGATPVRLADGEPAPPGTRLVWLNSPSNPTGRVQSAAALAQAVADARAVGAVVASDECYLALSWTATPVSALRPEVSGGSPDGVLAVHSLSKSSSLAGYRAGFVTGDPALVASLLEVRKHAGMIVPRPVQAAMAAALSDDAHVAAQRSRYEARRAVLLPALEAAGFTVDHSEAGLYLWSTRGESAWDTVAWLADRGVLVAPGTFYGPTGDRHVRIALTASDERVAAAVDRLTA